MKKVLIIAVFVLSGCAQSQMRLLENSGTVRVDPGQPPLYDYVVSMRNQIDFGYNPDDKANRDAFALRYLKTQCPNGKVVGYTVIDTGEYLGGRPSRTYQVQIKCNPN